MELVVANLSFDYDSGHVLHDISFKTKTGDILLVKGANGSGKSTLLKCLVGLLNAGNSVTIDGVSINDNPALLQQMAYIMAEDTLYEYLTVTENAQLFAELFGESQDFLDRVQEMFGYMNVSAYKNYLVKHLSTGTRHKVYLAIMLSKKADILILDEPFSSIDKKTQELMFDYIQRIQKQKLIIYVTHIEAFEQLATCSIFLPKEVDTTWESDTSFR